MNVKYCYSLTIIIEAYFLRLRVRSIVLTLYSLTSPSKIAPAQPKHPTHSYYWRSKFVGYKLFSNYCLLYWALLQINWNGMKNWFRCKFRRIRQTYGWMFVVFYSRCCFTLAKWLLPLNHWFFSSRIPGKTYWPNHGIFPAVTKTMNRWHGFSDGKKNNLNWMILISIANMIKTKFSNTCRMEYEQYQNGARTNGNKRGLNQTYCFAFDWLQSLRTGIQYILAAILGGGGKVSDWKLNIAYWIQFQWNSHACTCTHNTGAHTSGRSRHLVGARWLFIW